MPLQEFIHKLTEGSANRFLQSVLVLFAMIGLTVWYDAAQFKNMSTIEGMDAAQVARCVSEGRGFSTQFVRPLSVYLVRKHQKGDARSNEKRDARLNEKDDGRLNEKDDARLNGEHPDLANAPLYPLVLAGALKVNPLGWPDVRPDANPGQTFAVYVPDLWVAMVNQGLFYVAVWLVFRLGRRLFDDSVAWVSAAVFAGSELFWRFSVSGQSTMLLVVVFLALVEVLARIEPETKEGATRGPKWLLGMAALAGVLTGLAGMTRYGFAFLIFPVGLFLGSLPTPKKMGMAGVAAGTFLLVMGPWVARNFAVSGTPFGTAGYAIMENTDLFQEHSLERTLNPDFSLMNGGMIWQKALSGIRDILEKDLPRLGGSWVSAFFLVGLLVPFRKTVLVRLRGFLAVSLGLLLVVQALGRTGLSTESPEVTTENLLVVLAPMVFMFGVSLFFVLLEQFGVAMPAFRLMAVGAFVAVANAPLIISLLSPLMNLLLGLPGPNRLSYPPYYPPYIQEKSEWVAEDALIMSDFPWAVAWYGHRQSVWLSLKFSEEPSIRLRNDFEAMNHCGKPIRGLYLSARTMKTVTTAPLHSWVMRQGVVDQWEPYAKDWEGFVLVGAFLFRQVPTGFALKQPPFGLLPELFLTDSERPAGKPIKAR